MTEIWRVARGMLCARDMRALAACAVAAVSLHSLEAAACGCFASSTTIADPVIQAGERIAFAVDGNTVTAYVQIKFQGQADDFGWLVPVPAVPVVKAGTDELFEVLDENTRPQFQLRTTVSSSCRGSSFSFGCASKALSSGGGPSDPVGSGPLVLRDTTGPYEYAVLKADSMTEVRQWLQDNRYFVPVSSDAALAPYVRPGAFFLALKLRSGQTAGDLRPVVLSYTSDYAMIPLVLTSATAVPNMGVQVFMLGSARAVPRNYHHVQLNTLKLDWAKAENYVALVTAAVAEAPKKHAFVTEYAGPASVARNQLGGASRFGDRATLAQSADAAAFVSFLLNHGYGPRGVVGELPAALMGVLEAQIPYPPAFAANGVDRLSFYKDLSLYLSTEYQASHASWYAGWKGLSFDAVNLAEAVWTGYAQPILDAETMLDTHAYLTRMFTTLSPEDMTEDPVFGFNPTLPEVAAVRSASRTTGCSGVPTSFDTELYQVPDESKLTDEKKASLPAAAVIEQLPEEGAPVEVSRYALDMDLMSVPHGCAIADGAFFAGLAAMWLLVRRRKIP